MPYDQSQLIKLLTQQAGPRGFTYAGRVAEPGMSLGSILSQMGTIADMDEGNLAPVKPKLDIQSRLAGDILPESARTNYVSPAMIGKNIRNNVTNMAGMANAENLMQPLSPEFQARANTEQAGIFNSVKDLYNYLFPYNINISDFLPK